MLLGFITLISVYQFLYRTDETNCCHSYLFLQLLSMSVVFFNINLYDVLCVCVKLFCYHKTRIKFEGISEQGAI